MRHAESLFNINLSNDRDVGLSDYGINQASNITGYYDIVICSPLKRCIETLKYSNIKYDKLIIEPIVREVIKDNCDLMINENEPYENENNVIKRIELFKQKLQLYKEQLILVLCHSDFIWYLTSYDINGERFGKYIDNAEVIEYINEI